MPQSWSGCHREQRILYLASTWTGTSPSSSSEPVTILTLLSCLLLCETNRTEKRQLPKCACIPPCHTQCQTKLCHDNNKPISQTYRTGSHMWKLSCNIWRWKNHWVLVTVLKIILIIKNSTLGHTEIHDADNFKNVVTLFIDSQSYEHWFLLNTGCPLTTRW